MAREATAMAPNHALAQRVLAWHLFELGQTEEAMAELQTYNELLGDHEVVTTIERLYTGGDYRDAALAVADILEARAETTFVKPGHVVFWFYKAGDLDRAAKWWERAYERRDSDMAYLTHIPYSEAFKADPRFREMLRRMNLP